MAWRPASPHAWPKPNEEFLDPKQKAPAPGASQHGMQAASECSASPSGSDGEQPATPSRHALLKFAPVTCLVMVRPEAFRVLVKGRLLDVWLCSASGSFGGDVESSVPWDLRLAPLLKNQSVLLVTAGMVFDALVWFGD